MFFLKSLPETEKTLGTSFTTGLSKEVAEERLLADGPNELKEGDLRSPWRILWEQFTATMVLILIGSASLALVLQAYKDAIAIFAVVILFGLLGFFQEWRAEKAVAALRKLAIPKVRVKRNGEWEIIDANRLVAGDLVEIEAGSIVPADGRLVEVASLDVQEAALTGESEAVHKQTEALSDKDLTIGERTNMVAMGTSVVKGRGLFAVSATGMRTELGKIAALIQGVQRKETPLQVKLGQLGRLLSLFGVLIIIALVAIGLAQGKDLRELFLMAVSLAVAIIPEGLPAVVTITLSLGAQRMLKRHALIRKLPSVETLGSVTVICSDKTGTLTENRMTVIALDIAGHRIELTESFRAGKAELKQDPFSLQTPGVEALFPVLVAGALCNDARKVKSESGTQAVGDPTEAALVVAAGHFGIDKSVWEKHFPRVNEFPFDSDRKRMTTVHRILDSAPRAQVPFGNSPFVALCKGGVDGLLDCCSHILFEGQIQAFSEEFRTRVTAANDSLARQGMRVLGAAFRNLSDPADFASETNLVFCGLFGLIDPPRPEVKDAVTAAKQAGIRLVMITGDHPLTAMQIAKDLGFQNADTAITGRELETLSQEELQRRVASTGVFARVAPEHKLRIVNALQANGEIASMTGDGVNDAPALRQADIGVAMGITGTDVSKEAASMVLLDDNFATIISAVREGRTVYANVRKFVKFSVAGNIGKVLVVFLAPLLVGDNPLQPLQLLWLNLLTDGLLGLGLGVEGSEPDVMNVPPFGPKESIFSRGIGINILVIGPVIAFSVLGLTYFASRQEGWDWSTITFTSLAFAQVGEALAARSVNHAFWSKAVAPNPVLSFMIAFVVLAQILVIFVPFLSPILGTSALSLTQLLLCFVPGFIAFGVAELLKRAKRR